MESKEVYLLREEVLKDYLTAVVEEVYSKHPTELHIQVDAELDSIPQMSVAYKTYIMPGRDDE